MKREDADPFRQVIAATYTLYGKELSAQALSLWFEALKRYELRAISAALSAHCTNPDTGQFLPRPADVVKMIEGGSDDAALVAWAKLDRALRVVGPHATVVFDDPLIHLAVEALGGWVKLGHLTEEDWKFQRQSFVTVYRGARQRPGSAQHPAKLPGISESTNGAKHREAPTFIGNADACRAVYESGGVAQRLAVTRMADLIPRIEHHQEAA